MRVVDEDEGDAVDLLPSCIHFFFFFRKIKEEEDDGEKKDKVLREPSHLDKVRDKLVG